LSLLQDIALLRRGWRWGEPRPASWQAVAPAIPEPASNLNWARAEPVRTLRWMIQRGLSLPFTRLMANPLVEGREWLSQLDRPALLVSNHVSHADTQLLLYALPDRVRERTVVAAAADYWYRHRWLGRLVSLGLNTFPFSRTGSPQAVLSSSQQLLKAGWNLLVYAEGGRSPDGTLQPFKPGLGYLAVESRTPVVPMHVRGSDRIMPKGSLVPLPSPAQIRIGKPLWPQRGEGARAFTQRAEAAVRTLADSPDVSDRKGGFDAGSEGWIERWRATARTHQRS
jgi:1-acyl-sn-glycerol-3-phosphate acyltransferase